MSFDLFLDKALGLAFPDYASLALVVRRALDKNLNDIADPDAMTIVRGELTEWLRASGGLGEFLRGARKANPSNLALRNAAWLYDLLPLLKGGDEWQGAANAVYQRLPRPSLGSKKPAGELQLEDLILALASEDDWKDDTVPHVPLLDFVQRLTEQIEARAAAKAPPLRKWLDQAIADLGWSDDDVERLRFGWKRRAQRPAAGGVARLLVRVTPALPPDDKDANGEQVYAVKAWLADTDDPKPLLGNAERRAAKDELHKLMDECRAGLGRAGLRPDQVRLELTLPRALLGEAIDRWEDAEDDTPLGSLHSLVLRCWERLKMDDWSAALGRHLNTFHAARKPLTPVWDVDDPVGDEPEAVWIGADRPGGAVLRVSLQNRAHCCVCVLERAPQPAAGEPRTDILNTLLRAGIPAVLWARQPPDPANALQGVFKTLFDTGVYLDELPDVVYRQRANAFTPKRLNAIGCGDWYLGQHVALIWDDPRYPPSPEDDYTFRLRSPAP